MKEPGEGVAENGVASRSPLDTRHREAGGRMIEFAGWEMPVQYSGLMEEHRAVRTAAGLFDISHMGEVRVDGGGAESFLQYLTPNDVSKLVPGQAHYSALLSEEGTYIDDVLVYRLGETEFLLVVNAANRAGDFDHIRELAQDDVTVEDVSDDYALLALQGPRAPEILSRLTAAELSELKYYRFLDAQVHDRPALVSRTGYTGEDGFELYVAPETAPSLWDALMEAGAEAGLKPAGLGARDTLRLEAGMALYGHEIDRFTYPWEAGLGWTIKLKKGAFVGSEALARVKAEGIRRRLVGFEIHGRGIARQGHTIWVDDEEVGAVTSGTWSPTVEKALGMAYVPKALAAVGTELEFDVRGRRLQGAVVELPFYKRPK
ncbi:MAG: glycine cleavage system aminomethyltransferase GcvT [Acidobacteriota bacterium]|nr:glycine cleavage system aminomethyltransferase GcvT [Acidobacteriota bacterium]